MAGTPAQAPPPRLRQAAASGRGFRANEPALPSGLRFPDFCRWSRLRRNVLGRGPIGLIDRALEEIQLGCMAGQGAAAGSDHRDSLKKPPGHLRHSVGAVHLWGYLPHCAGPAKDVLAYAI